jgi:hypothetical protein
MSKLNLSMRAVLEQAGFRIRGATRADCIHCEGHSRGTVSFTDKVAYCHRCKWRANTLSLVRELGLPRRDPKGISELQQEAQQRARLRIEIQPFESWREAKIREISELYRSLFRAAAMAQKLLLEIPDCEEAWDALSRFYHAEAQLSAAFDWLMFTKASVWLEADSSPVDVFESWRSHAA